MPLVPALIVFAIIASIHGCITDTDNNESEYKHCEEIERSRK